jgi:hypothetical protein
MRAALVAALAAGLLLVASGCGSSNAATDSLGQDAASLVPPSAVAFVAADSHLDADQWAAIRKLAPAGSVDPDLIRDLPAAFGDQVNLAVLSVDKGKPDAIAIARPKDESKLRTFAQKYSQGGEHYTIQHVSSWSVVADSDAAFQAVRDAAAGTSLADTEAFKNGMAELDGSAVAKIYASAQGLKLLPAQTRALLGSPQWVAARVEGAKDSVMVDVHASGPTSLPSYKPTLLRDVPSGSILAVSFKDASKLPFLQEYLRGVTGEGVLYIVPGAILPVITLEVQPQDPAAAALTFRKIAKKIGTNVPLNVERRSSKVLLTTAAAGLPTGGKSIVDDTAFKDALKSVDAADQVTFLVYADVNRLAPLIQAFGPLLSKGGTSKIEIPKDLDTLVAWGSTTRVEVRLTVR